MNIELFDMAIHVDDGMSTPGCDAKILMVTETKAGSVEVCIETRVINRTEKAVKLNSARIKLDEAALRALADWLRRRGYLDRESLHHGGHQVCGPVTCTEGTTR